MLKRGNSVNTFSIILIIWNIITALLYGIDKHCARKKKRRISERCLILVAFLFRNLGAMIGMIMFNHKTSKTKFRILIPVSFVVDILLIVSLDYITR